jgi:glycosyltransferase involved in cell wall biosynthesis
MSAPLVSFCIPVHNAGQYLQQTIQAILDQNYENVEIVCVNDHSTDDSLNVLNSFGAKVRVLQAEKKGAAAARNQAFRNSKGEYIVFFDADDLLPHNYLSSQVKKLKQHPGKVVICNWGRFYDDVNTYKEDPNIIKSDLSFYDWIVKYWTFNNHTTPPGRIMLPRSVIEQAGLWKEELSLNDDLDFYSRMFAAAGTIIFNDETSFYYRSGISGLSSKKKGYNYQLSNLRSIESATELALGVYPDDVKIKKACANMWQQFIYDHFPHNKELLRYANNKINELGGADFPYPAGGVTKILSKTIGWKITSYIKLMTSR